MAVSANGRAILTTSLDKTIRLWDAETGQALATLRGHAKQVNGAAFSPNSEQVVSASTDRTARVWHVQSGQERALLTTGATSGPRVLASYDPQGHHVLVLTQVAPRTMIWNTATGVQQLSVAGQSWEQGSASNLFATCSDDFVHLRDKSSGEEQAFLPSHRGDFREVRLSEDGQIALAIVNNGPTWLWDWKIGRHVELLGHKESVNSAAISPDGQKAATASANGSAPSGTRKPASCCRNSYTMVAYCRLTSPVTGTNS